MKSNDYYTKSKSLHKKLKGKLEVKIKSKITKKNLPLLYTPGVAEPCRAIHKNNKLVYDYTWKNNTIAIITNGTAVLGLGNMGPEASLPVMEGKSILFKEFGNVNAIPIALDTENADKLIETVKLLAPSFGGINLEDIKAPECFYIEEKLIKELDIPVFHDDQHGTAIVVFAGLINALKLTNKKLEKIKIVINGAGAAGIAITKFLLKNKVKDIILCDSKGIIYKNRKGMNAIKKEIANITNKKQIKGALKDAIKNADVFIGVSVANILNEEMIKSMNKNPILFTLANPDPEIKPELARKYGVKIIATGRSDYPNQINNLLAFPGIFRGTLDARAKKITFKMKQAAAYAIANMINKKKLSYDYFIPEATNRKIHQVVANAVKKAV